jgi:hypothetical protein
LAHRPGIAGAAATSLKTFHREVAVAPLRTGTQKSYSIRVFSCFSRASSSLEHFQ